MRPRAWSSALELGLEIDLRQTDDEAELIGWVHEAFERRLPVVINPAAFTHYSYALRDALAMLTRSADRGPPVEPGRPRVVPAHLSCVGGRDGTIAGFGLQSYELALRAVARLLKPAAPGEPPAAPAS